MSAIHPFFKHADQCLPFCGTCLHVRPENRHDSVKPGCFDVSSLIFPEFPQLIWVGFECRQNGVTMPPHVCPQNFPVVFSPPGAYRTVYVRDDARCCHGIVHGAGERPGHEFDLYQHRL